MSTPRFPDFKNLIDQLIGSPIHNDSKKQHKNLEGGMNNIYFEVVPVKHEIIETTVNNPEIKDKTTKHKVTDELITVYSDQNLVTKILGKINDKPLSILHSAAQTDLNNEFEHKKIIPPLNSPFLQKILCRGKFFKMTEKYITDLVRFKNHPLRKKVMIDFKEIFAQITWAIYDLHLRNIVHRDVKISNILVNLKDGCFLHVILADLDTIAYADDRNIKFIGTQGYIPPEILYGYSVLDKKAFDCYALGVTFSKIFKIYKNSSSVMYEKLIVKLIRGLLNKEPSNRLTIDKVMNHQLFGETPQECKAYFSHIYKKFSKESYFDGYFQSPADSYPEKDYTFYILPKIYKEIYHIASELNDLISSVTFQNQCNNKILLILIDKKSKYLFQLTNNTVSTKLINKFRQYALETYYAIPLIIKNLLMKSVEPRILKEAVSDAVVKYIKVNKLENIKPGDRYFEKMYKHGIISKKIAESFVNKVNAITHGDSVEIYQTIHNYLIINGIASEKTSFKTILQENIINIEYQSTSIELLLEDIPQQNKLSSVS